MRPLSNAELLAVWESAAPRTAAERALSLVASAEPEASVESLSRASIGQRDLRLMRLREATFGSKLEIAGSCPKCGAPFELEMRVSDLVVDEPRAVAERHVIDAGGERVVVRVPDSLDLAAVAGASSRSEVARMLLERCVVEGPAELSPATRSAIAARLREIDPQADVELAIACPACAHQWNAPFDIAAYFWMEIDAWAGRLLFDVHLLARAYGWREHDILAMSHRRRQAYLDLIGA